MNRDPSYRYYNCNLQAPKIKCHTVTADTLHLASMNGLFVESGDLPYGNVFDVTVQSLLKDTACGEVTCYIVNDAAFTSGVLLITAFKSNKLLNAILYQNIGNYTSGVGVTITIVNNITIRITLPTGNYGTCQWVFRGV